MTATPTKNSLMLRYWTTIGDNLAALSGKKKVTITLQMSSKTKDIDVNVSGGNITIKASSAIEPAEWDQKIAKGFARAKL